MYHPIELPTVDHRSISHQILRHVNTFCEPRSVFGNQHLPLPWTRYIHRGAFSCRGSSSKSVFPSWFPPFLASAIRENDGFTPWREKNNDAKTQSFKRYHKQHDLPLSEELLVQMSYFPWFSCKWYSILWAERSNWDGFEFRMELFLSCEWIIITHHHSSSRSIWFFLALCTFFVRNPMGYK